MNAGNRVLVAAVVIVERGDVIERVGQRSAASGIVVASFCIAAFASSLVVLM